MASRIFTQKEAHECTRRYGFFYLLTNDGSIMLPATHLGPNRAGIYSASPHSSCAPGIVNWKVWDADGKIVLHGEERFYSPEGGREATQDAIEALRRCGCAVEVAKP